MEHLSWDEAERRLSECYLVLLPLGARLKSHGFHLPLNNDWLLAEGLTKRVVESASLDLLVVPTLSHHFYPGLVEYPGTVSLRLETAVALVVDICTSLARHGAPGFYILNTGVSTVRALEPARRELAERQISMDYSVYEKMLEGAGLAPEQPGGTHADEFETSLMLELAPEVVRMERAQADYTGKRGSGLTRDRQNQNSTYSPTGAWGDPTRATRAKGKRLLKAALAYLTKQLEEAVTRRTEAS